MSETDAIILVRKALGFGRTLGRDDFGRSTLTGRRDGLKFDQKHGKAGPKSHAAESFVGARLMPAVSPPSFWRVRLDPLPSLCYTPV